MKNKVSKPIKTEAKEAVLSFLKLTKEGKYAEIDKVSLNYSRYTIERDDTELATEDLHYSLT